MRFSKIEPRECVWCRETYDAKVTYTGYAANGGYCDVCRGGRGDWEVQPRTIVGLTLVARARLAAWVRRDNAGGPGECSPAGAFCQRTTLADGRTRLTWPSGEATFHASADPKAVDAFVARLEKDAKAEIAIVPILPEGRVTLLETAGWVQAPESCEASPLPVTPSRRDTRMASGLTIPTNRRTNKGPALNLRAA